MPPFQERLILLILFHKKAINDINSLHNPQFFHTRDEISQNFPFKLIEFILSSENKKNFDGSMAFVYIICFKERISLLVSIIMDSISHLPVLFF